LLLKLIPKELIIKYNVLPVSLIGNNLTLAMMDPMNIVVIDNIKTVTGFTVMPVVAAYTDLKDTIGKCFIKKNDDEDVKPDETFDEIMRDIQDIEDLELIKDHRSSDQNVVEELNDEAPIIKLTDTIIQQSVVSKASDVFIEPLENAVRIRYRVDGVIREIDRLTKVLHFPIISRIKVISNLDISEHRLPQDGRFKMMLAGGKFVDFRVNVLPTVMGEKAVLRVLDQETAYLDVNKLGFENKALEDLKVCATKPHGLILTCGPTGSGKTTTLYSILKYVDSPEKNIVTVEDPVEYQMKGANQVNVKPHIGLTFSTSLRSILRQDPDVILIGEIRDAETLSIAVKAALTGHLVLSSLHTTTAAGSVVRMMNMGIEPFLICSSVLAIVAQRLLRKICPYCKEKYEVSDVIIERMKLKKFLNDEKIELFRGKGCKKCFNTGYSGRVGINEILIFTAEIRELVLHNAGEVKIKNLARRQGMQTMREDGLSKAISGLTTLDEVIRITAPDEEIIQ
ncbi:MAG: type II/IV secretion system protein, partial [Candidatus Omnitrophica bacterium]|nr:type II/IV secretion system protein [Candidatus Omnitrophota bacterium]